MKKEEFIKTVKKAKDCRNINDCEIEIKKIINFIATKEGKKIYGYNSIHKRYWLLSKARDYFELGWKIRLTDEFILEVINHFIKRSGVNRFTPKSIVFELQNNFGTLIPEYIRGSDKWRKLIFPIMFAMARLKKKKFLSSFFDSKEEITIFWKNDNHN